MKIFFLGATMAALMSCSHIPGLRGLASDDTVKLPGTALGAAMYPGTSRTVDWKATRRSGSVVKKYKYVPSTKNQMAVRTYFREVEGKPGSYNVLILEYVDLVKMAPKYIFSNKSSLISDKIGYLNQINSRITAYRANPTAEEGKFEMQKLHYRNGVLEEDNKPEPSMLILGEDKANPIAGAKITAAKDGEPVEIQFPKDKDHDLGKQHSLAAFTYNKVKLNSTWRSDYLPGPYLGAYYDKKDVILDLKKKDGILTAKFMINKDRSHLSKKKREKQLTNAKSAYIEGDFIAKKVEDGIFVFEAKDNNVRNKDYVEGKLGLFIDIFDATEALGQDVVELVIVDSNAPTDFLMYYEHPENGEGQDHKNKNK